jgi:hypothetical protein
MSRGSASQADLYSPSSIGFVDFGGITEYNNTATIKTIGQQNN